jgi:hypothetical protein
VDKNGKRFTVSELECVDASGKITVSVWGRAYAAVEKIPNGEGVTLVGVTATRENGEVKLNLWPSAHVLRGEDPAQSLTSLDVSSLQQVVLLTATFVPSHAPIDVDKDAHPACAAALAAAAGCSGDVVFQITMVSLMPQRAKMPCSPKISASSFHAVFAIGRGAWMWR